MLTNTIDLTIPAYSYFFGFVQGDGSLYQNKANPNKGKLSIEVSIRDRDIVDKFCKLIEGSTITYRSRSTNFSEDYNSIVWTMCHQSFREEMNRLGIPIGTKSDIVKPPVAPYCIADYWRGLIDADGSLGMTSDSLPFLSFITTSTDMAIAYEQFLFGLIGKRKTLNRNKRDNAYNIVVLREDAIKVVSFLYYPSCLGLDRKIGKAKEVMSWVRPNDMKKAPLRQLWTSEEDAIVLTNSQKDAATRLGRSVASVANRKKRLKQKMACPMAGEGEIDPYKD